MRELTGREPVIVGEIQPYAGARVAWLTETQASLSGTPRQIAAELARLRSDRGVVRVADPVPLPGLPGQMHTVATLLPYRQREHVVLPRRGTNPYVVAGAAGFGVTAAAGLSIVTYEIVSAIVANLAIVVAVVVIVALLGGGGVARKCITRVTVEHWH